MWCCGGQGWGYDGMSRQTDCLMVGSPLGLLMVEQEGLLGAGIVGCRDQIKMMDEDGCSMMDEDGCSSSGGRKRLVVVGRLVR